MENAPQKRAGKPIHGRQAKRRWGDVTTNDKDSTSIMGSVVSGFSTAPSTNGDNQKSAANIVDHKHFKPTSTPYTSLVAPTVPRNYTGVTSLKDQLTPIQPKSMNIVKPFVHSQLRVNQKIVLEQERRRQAKHIEKIVENAKNPVQNKFFDSNIVGGKRMRSTISFVAEGYFAQKEAKQAARVLGVSLNDIDTSLSVIPSVPVVLKSEILIPPIEPWDLEFIKDQNETLTLFDEICIDENKVTYFDLWNIMNTSWAKTAMTGVVKKLSSCIDAKKVSVLIQHPVPILPKGYSDSSFQKVYLTNAERIRLRRRRRREVELDKQDKIRIGLIPPPPPKVKLANLNRVLGVESAADPSSVEARVRADMKKRIGDHEKANLDKKLKPEQKREKKIAYWKQEEAQKSNTLVHVFSLPKASRDTLYKLDQNAQQLHLTGFMVAARVDRIGIIVVEGGPRAVRRFKRLVLRRLKWAGKSLADIIQEDDDEIEDTDNFYGGKGHVDYYSDIELERLASSIVDDRRPQIFWKGYLREPKFNKWKYMNKKGDNEIQKYLENRDAMFYWNLLEKCRIKKDDKNIE